MTNVFLFRLLIRAPSLFVLAVILLKGPLCAEQIRVSHPQGSAHGFLALKTLEGATIAIGDVTQTVRGDRVTSRVTFRFHDGSIDDESTVFSQRRTFRLISDHHIQRGPSFPKPIDVQIDAVAGQITSRDQSGKISVDRLKLPDDVANGLPPNLLMNVSPTTPETKISFIAPTAKPRLIHLSIKPAGSVPFAIGGMPRKATDFVVHVELGGIVGVVAPVIGKQPPDYHIWILTGPTPAFIREEGPLFEGGPIWRIEQISPSFRR